MFSRPDPSRSDIANRPNTFIPGEAVVSHDDSLLHHIHERPTSKPPMPLSLTSHVVNPGELDRIVAACHDDAEEPPHEPSPSSNPSSASLIPSTHVRGDSDQLLRPSFVQIQIVDDVPSILSTTENWKEERAAAMANGAHNFSHLEDLHGAAPEYHSTLPEFPFDHCRVSPSHPFISTSMMLPMTSRTPSSHATPPMNPSSRCRWPPINDDPDDWPLLYKSNSLIHLSSPEPKCVYMR